MAGKSGYGYFDITLKQRTQISTSLVRFTFSGPDVHQMATYAPDQRIKLFFPDGDASLEVLSEIARQSGPDWYSQYRALDEQIRPPMRTYTIRALRAQDAEVDIEFVLHGDTGPASRWATRAQPGDGLGMIAPVNDSEAEPAGFEWRPPQGMRRLLLVADETAVPAACGILESLQASGQWPQVDAFFEVPAVGDAQPLGDEISQAHVNVQWLNRDRQSDDQDGHGDYAHGDLLIQAVKSLDLSQEIRELQSSSDDGVDSQDDADDRLFWVLGAPDDGAPFYAWIAAESKVARSIRQYLVKDCGLPKAYVSSMGYWREGKVLG